MKTMHHLIAYATVASLSWAGLAEAGNYRPTGAAAESANRQPAATSTAQGGSSGLKTAWWLDGCYSTPVCGTSFVPVTRCQSSCSPRYYFPASPYGGYPYGGGYPYNGYGGGFGGYGYGSGYGSGYGNVINYGPSYSVPSYNTPLINPAVPGPVNPGIGPVPNGAYYPQTLPGYAPNNWNVGYTPGYVGSNVIVNPYYP